ncbi:MAG: GvpL/GvpF family gas vesicle protein [Actinobacteria bacterium]|nr:GvpL/GvpF family gas vesicle protein [Actinomycetota bacterium]
MAGNDLDPAIEALAGELAPRLTAALLRRCREELREVGEEAMFPDEAEQVAEPEEPVVGGSDGPADHPGPHPLAEHARREAIGHYVYGVVRAEVPLPRDLVGADPTAPVELIEEAGLAALVSEVPLAEFDEGSLRENLNDVAWLEEKARAHEHVLDVALAGSAVVPLRLCTVFTTEEQVRGMLARERAVLFDALGRLDGRAEWGVKAYADRGAVESEALARVDRPDGADDEVTAGTAYMNRRRREARAREQVEEIADEWARAIHGGLAAIAVEALLNPLQRPELSGRDGEMFLNGVYLIDDVEAAAFRAAVATLAEDFDRRGVALDLTGPWPAYNFVKSSIEAAR